MSRESKFSPYPLTRKTFATLLAASMAISMLGMQSSARTWHMGDKESSAQDKAKPASDTASGKPVPTASDPAKTKESPASLSLTDLDQAAGSKTAGSAPAKSAPVTKTPPVYLPAPLSLMDEPANKSLNANPKDAPKTEIKKPGAPIKSPVAGEPSGSPVTGQSNGSTVAGQVNASPTPNQAVGSPVAAQPATGTTATNQSNPSPAAGQGTASPVAGQATATASNPPLVESTGPPEWHKLQMRVSGSMCVACLKELEERLQKLAGVDRVRIEKSQTNYFQPYSPDVTSWADGIVLFDVKKLPLDYLRDAIRQAGYHSYKIVDRSLARSPESKDLKF